jgi:hypothetical protein
MSFIRNYDVAVQYINPPAPSVTTFAATAIGATTATLTGAFNPNGFAATATLQSGLTTSYGTSSPVTLVPANGTSAQTFSVNLTGLSPGTTYHYQATATNLGGTGSGGDVTFTTAFTPSAWRQTWYGRCSGCSRQHERRSLGMSRSKNLRLIPETPFAAARFCFPYLQ